MTRSGQVTAGTVDVIADGAVTPTLGFFLFAVVAVPIDNFQLYWVNLVSALVMPTVHAWLVRSGSEDRGLKRRQVIAFDALHLVYLGVIVFWVLDPL